MRKPLSLKHRVKIVGRPIDITHTDIRKTFARARAEQDAARKAREQYISDWDAALAEYTMRERESKVRTLRK